MVIFVVIDMLGFIYVGIINMGWLVCIVKYVKVFWYLLGVGCNGIYVIGNVGVVVGDSNCVLLCILLGDICWNSMGFFWF